MVDDVNIYNTYKAVLVITKISILAPDGLTTLPHSKPLLLVNKVSVSVTESQKGSDWRNHASVYFSTGGPKKCVLV